VSAAGVAERLRDSPLGRAVREALGEEAPGRSWVVGGAVRDAALGRPVSDLDLAFAGDPRGAAAAIARGGGGSSFELSAEFETWRARDRGGEWQVDVTPLRGEGIEGDLAARDFTIGAVAVPLGGGEALDPFDGLGDLERRTLRMVSERSFADDPLRLLRAARLAAELELEIEAGTEASAKALAERASEPAGERVLGELRLLIAGPDPLGGLDLIERLGIMEPLLPEVAALRGVDQTANHHLDVYDHTMAVLERLLEVEDDLERFAGARAQETRELLDEPLADELTRGEALRFGALVHDFGKPVTRSESGGRVTFMGHDAAGAEIIGAMAARLRASRALTRHLQALTLHHLRLGFMVPEAPLPLRRVHDYLRATDPVGADVTLLTVADRLAARGSGPLASEEMVEAHLALARQMLAAALDWRRQGPPARLIAGDELAAELGIPEGPELGRLLAELEAAQYAGEVRTREEALAHARGDL
jgi:putative nucleotidyltransferase with HDIG domain